MWIFERCLVSGLKYNFLFYFDRILVFEKVCAHQYTGFGLIEILIKILSV